MATGNIRPPKLVLGPFVMAVREGSGSVGYERVSIPADLRPDAGLTAGAPLAPATQHAVLCAQSLLQR